MGVAQAQKTHCPHGHPYSPENTYVRPCGRRVCRECRRIKLREDYKPTGRKRGVRPNERRRRLIVALRDAGWSYRRIGRKLGITDSAVCLALQRMGYTAKVEACVEPIRLVPEARVWCRQCERNVLVAEGRQCRSPFCKAMEMAA